MSKEAKCDGCGAVLGDTIYFTDTPLDRRKTLKYAEYCPRCGKKAFKKAAAAAVAIEEGA